MSTSINLRSNVASMLSISERDIFNIEEKINDFNNMKSIVVTLFSGNVLYL